MLAATLLKQAVAALAASVRVRAVAEVVEDECAVARFGVAEGDHLAELALFERGAARDVFRAYAQARRGLLVEHEYAARAPRRSVADDAAFGERRKSATKRAEFRAERLGEVGDVDFRFVAFVDVVIIEQTEKCLLELCAASRAD